ncbi:MAG: hypothetical protein A3F72_03235 [Bacteroidetes bacterium RIFCSPLOWO2_12_FULL_35_15]|nr:MAG: hypothetical protein A3F72_03235 [Bacteroidetes bacterium RIFCSPLOWO2_12_FULL_35_15]
MTSIPSKEIKIQLHSKCLEFVEQRIANARLAINAATDSGNDETKSSAGDKHETGRAMAQLEQEKSGKQLHEALELKKMLNKISVDQNSKMVSLGSLVVTSNGNFYISISMGKIVIDNITYYAISPITPIATLLMGNIKNYTFNFNSQFYIIENIL